MSRQTVEKIVANPTTNGIIVILDDGKVIAHVYQPFKDEIKAQFAGEVNGTEDLTIYRQNTYAAYADEVEHPDAKTVYSKEKGWLI